MTLTMKPGQGAHRATTKQAVVEIVVPVYNEAADREASVRRLTGYLAHEVPYRYRVTIADNASTDDTLAIAGRLAAELDGVGVVHLAAKGRGRALKQVWLASHADVVAYMDVDLSTDLAALLPLLAPLVSGHSDVAIGSRLATGSRVVRGPKREFISRCYNLMLRGALQVSFSDAQCGFKAMRSDVARRLLPWCKTPTGSSTPSCWCSPSAPGCAFTRFRSTGWTTRAPPSTSPPPRPKTCAASGG